MKHIKKIISITFIIGTLLASCSDFLDEKAKGSQVSDNYFMTEADAIAATDAIYSYLISDADAYNLWSENFGGLFYNDFWEIPELMSDNAISKHSSPDFQSMSRFEVDAFNSRIACLWRDFYTTINVCNTVIDKVPRITFTDEVMKNQLIAEAKFFRALSYFELTRFFGDVPLHLKPTESVLESQVERTEKEVIYTHIFEDLVFAEENLKYENRLGLGRPYALSASALLARVYLTIGQGTKDVELLQKAVDKADLVIPAFPMGSYEDLFKLENRFINERIWEVNFNASLSQGWKGNQFLVKLLPKMDTGKGGANNAQGWLAATSGLYDSFEIGDKRRDVTLFKSFEYSDGSNEVFDAPYFCKYWDQIAEPKGNESNATFPYLRTAEMYLIKAEALNEIHQKPTQESKDALNAIRTRAGLHPTDADNFKDFKKAILNERRFEFAIEGHRWHDLVRMCSFDELKQIIGESKAGVVPKEANFLLPIPNKDIITSNGRLTQNKGY